MAATGATPNSSVGAYARGSDMVANRDWRTLGDLLVDPNDSTSNPTRPTVQGSVATLFDSPDANGYRALRWASGQIEAAVTAGERYKPEDLIAMTQAQIIPASQGGDGVTTAYMVGKDILVGLCCDLAFWWLMKRRKPGLRPEDVSGAWDALDMLDQLRAGKKIFPFRETQEAGLPTVAPLDNCTTTVEPLVPISEQAGRYFGNRRRSGCW